MFRAIIQDNLTNGQIKTRLWALPGVADMDRISRNKLYDRIKQDVINEGGMAAPEKERKA